MANRKILIVDDEEDILDLYVQAFRAVVAIMQQKPRAGRKPWQ
jgi:DNA-binding NtrC family response regulator